MRVAVTGTPGTGKTTATDLVDADLRVVHLNDLVESERLYSEVDPDRDSLVADLGAVRDYLAGDDDIIVDSHLAHLVDADRVVVLRCAPDELVDRLTDRGDSEAKATENAEAESLDLILAEAVDIHGLQHVYEIDTTDLAPDAVAREIERVVAGDRDPSAGDVDFMEVP